MYKKMLSSFVGPELIVIISFQVKPTVLSERRCRNTCSLANGKAAKHSADKIPSSTVCTNIDQFYFLHHTNLLSVISLVVYAVFVTTGVCLRTLWAQIYHEIKWKVQRRIRLIVLFGEFPFSSLLFSFLFFSSLPSSLLFSFLVLLVCKHLWLCVCACVCACVYVCKYVRACVCVFVCVRACVSSVCICYCKRASSRGRKPAAKEIRRLH